MQHRMRKHTGKKALNTTRRARDELAAAHAPVCVVCALASLPARAQCRAPKIVCCPHSIHHQAWRWLLLPFKQTNHPFLKTNSSLSLRCNSHATTDPGIRS
jgi:hypothetical protein